MKKPNKVMYYHYDNYPYGVNIGYIAKLAPSQPKRRTGGQLSGNMSTPTQFLST